METTTYTGEGVNGAPTATDLPAVGQIVKTRAGTPRTRDLRWVVGRVVAHEFRAITGTAFGVWEMVVESTDERVQAGPGRLGEITAAEVTAFEAAERVDAETIAVTAAAMRADGVSVDPAAVWVVVGYVAAARARKTGRALTTHARRAGVLARNRLRGGNVAAALLAINLTRRVHAAC
ncbi:hypothetical protein ABZT26_36120 [Streptomyces sp. NPDC005395]|uniref:hypothetical protein n=1 Tax=Streptomyces sp. NPDC005395 TaxID=3157042 RepID=UPI0033BA6533